MFDIENLETALVALLKDAVPWVAKILAVDRFLKETDVVKYPMLVLRRAGGRGEEDAHPDDTLYTHYWHLFLMNDTAKRNAARTGGRGMYRMVSDTILALHGSTIAGVVTTPIEVVEDEEIKDKEMPEVLIQRITFRFGEIIE